MDDRMFISKSPEETMQLAEKIASMLRGGEAVCLSGELGAGKTIFAQGFIKFFLPKTRVVSPTFTIVRHYKTERKDIQMLYHLDLYRVQNSKEIHDTGISEFLNKPDSITLIEWAEKMADISIKTKIEVKLVIVDETKRNIYVKIRSSN
jgi:tRNA threonylcarbamoyladenosine biosynthesis protein TsaE